MSITKEDQQPAYLEHLYMIKSGPLLCGFDTQSHRYRRVASALK